MQLERVLWLQDTDYSENLCLCSDNNVLSGSQYFTAAFSCLICSFNNLCFLKDQPKIYLIHNASEFTLTLKIQFSHLLVACW